MIKYIDAEKLIAEIERYISHYESSNRDDFKNGELYICQELLSFVKSLRQEQPESSKGKFVFPNFLYARTVDNKTIDVSYAPQSMDAVEYIRNDSPHQERQGVDLEKVVMIDNLIMNMTAEGYNNGYKTRPFYEEVLRRLKARKEE